MQQTDAFIDWAGTYYPSMESVMAYGRAGRIVVDVTNDVGRVLTFATGEWTHLFGPGRKETRCRILIDIEEGKLIAAQEWTGLKFVDMGKARFDDLRESVIDVNEAHSSLQDWNYELVSEMPHWAKAQWLQSGKGSHYPLSQKALAQWYLALRAAGDWCFAAGKSGDSTALYLRAHRAAKQFTDNDKLSSTDEAVGKIRAMRDSGCWQ